MKILKTTATLPLRIVPGVIQAAMLTMTVNHLLRGQLLKDRLRELDGRSISVEVLDIPWLMHFFIRHGQVYATPDLPVADVIISGRLQSFLQLLRGRVDPDTLFFQRKLNVVGDTETGVHVKNLLDALEYDWDAHFDAVLVPPLARRARCVRQRISKYFSAKDTPIADRGPPAQQS